MKTTCTGTSGRSEGVLYVGLPVSVQYFACTSKATACSPICWRASTTVFHVGSLAFRSQRPSISCLQRSLPSPRWFCSIVRSSWSCRPSLTPSKCQFTTESSAFESSFRVGVAGAVGGEKIRSHSHKYSNWVRDTIKCSDDNFAWHIAKVEILIKLTFRPSSSAFRHLSCLLFQQTHPAWNVRRSDLWAPPTC